MKLTAIITTYNSEASIARVIESIRQQEGRGDQFNIEIIVVDDCSRDNTRAILDSLQQPYFSTDANSGGPNRGRNIGLAKATGDYICIVDHDDEWHRDRIRKLLPHLKAGNIVTSGHTVIDRISGKERIISCAGSGSTSKNFGINVTFLDKLQRNTGGQHTYLGSIVYPASLKHIRFEEVYGMVDYDWLLRLFHKRQSVEVCESLYNRYVAEMNLSMNEAYRLNDYRHSLEFVNTYRSEYPAAVKRSSQKINGTLARYYYVTGNMSEARRYFLRSGPSLKTFLYLLTSFAGAGFVKRKFNVFG